MQEIRKDQMGTDIQDALPGKTVSYSQFKLWCECPYQWKLKYVDKYKIDSGNIWTLLGTSLHEVIQEYLTVLYRDTIKLADGLNLYVLLQERLETNFNTAKEANNGVPICSLEEIMDAFTDGVAIIDELKKRRADYFPKKGVELLGIELPLRAEVRGNVYFTGFIDVILKEDDMIRIIDLKISNKGWSFWNKKDETKLAQLRLYKKFYSDLFNVPMINIVVEYIIFKRKLYDNVEFPQKRIQHFKPAQGKPSINSSLNLFNLFLDACFNAEGEYALDVEQPKKPGKFNCSFCPYGPRTEYSHLCDQNGEVVELYEPKVA